MNEYRVVWVKIPTAYNPRRTLFVEASSEADAHKLAINYLERSLGLERRKFQIAAVTEAEPVPAGSVKSGN